MTEPAVCKVEGCEQPELASRGRYAHLCQKHVEAKRESNGQKPDEAQVRFDGPTLLQNAADQVYEANLAYEAARARLEQAVAEVREILSRIGP